MTMKRISGITPETYQRLLYDSGAVYKDYGLPTEKLIGATRGGNTFVIEPENREMPVDGAPGPVKGSQRRLRSVAKLTVNLIEMTTEGILYNLPGAESAVSGGKDVITRDTQISSGDYLTNVTLVLEKAGTLALFGLKLKNCLALGNFEVGASEDDEPVNTIEFTAHFDPSDLGTEPWEIFNPLETGIFTLRYIAGANGYISGATTQVVASGANGTLVTAVPNAGYIFSAWSDSVATAARTDLAVGANITVTAVFIED
jgi:hypothetical protein